MKEIITAHENLLSSSTSVLRGPVTDMRLCDSENDSKRCFPVNYL